MITRSFINNYEKLDLDQKNSLIEKILLSEDYLIQILKEDNVSTLLFKEVFFKSINLFKVITNNDSLIISINNEQIYSFPIFCEKSIFIKNQTNIPEEIFEKLSELILSQLGTKIEGFVNCLGEFESNNFTVKLFNETKNFKSEIKIDSSVSLLKNHNSIKYEILFKKELDFNIENPLVNRATNILISLGYFNY